MTADLPDRATDREREDTCGDEFVGLLGISHVCRLPHGHTSAHRADDGARWAHVGARPADALAARPAPDDSGAKWPCVYDYDRTTCIREGHQHDAAPSSPQPGEALRELPNLHAQWHDQAGNLIGKDECGWEHCEFWPVAIFVLTGGERWD